MANLRNFVDSVIQNGGASYNLITGEFNPNEGYMVSIYGHETVSEYVPEAKNIQYALANYIKDKAHILMAGVTDSEYFVGAWVSNDKLYFDISVKTEYSRDAYKLAEENKQLAYFSNKRKESVYINTSK